jgi:hypothetical protein
LGVMYYGLQTNQNLGTGGQIIPGRDQNLSGEHQGEDRASWLARTASRAIQPVVPENGPEILKNATTPAGLDFVMQSVGGMLGQDGMLALTLAVESETKGYVPAKEELPIVSKIFAKYPTANVEPIRTFYERAERVQEVSATMKHLLTEDPERLAVYMVHNQEDLALIGVFDKSRQAIANYSRALQDLKDAPAGTFTSEDRRLYEKQYLQLMIETARQADMMARSVDKIREQRTKAAKGTSSPPASRP